MVKRRVFQLFSTCAVYIFTYLLQLFFHDDRRCELPFGTFLSTQFELNIQEYLYCEKKLARLLFDFVRHAKGVVGLMIMIASNRLRPSHAVNDS